MSTEAQTPADLEAKRFEMEAAAENANRSGVGLRVHTGKTRGKGSINIKWEQFDESKPETLPTSMQQFMDITSVKEESALVSLLITGFNDSQYTAASDPLAEFVEDYWPGDAKTQFRLVVRNYSRGANVPLEDAVSLIKPGFEKQFKK